MKYVKPVELYQKLKINSAKQKRLLGLDVGNKYIGLAVSDSKLRIASPHSVLERKHSNIYLMAQDFHTLVSKFKLKGFVVGYPFSLQGQSNVEAIQIKLFMEELKKTGKLDGMSYTYWDENYTSKCIEALMEPVMHNLHPFESKTILDKFAAVGILQGYLDNMKINDTSRTFTSEQ